MFFLFYLKNNICYKVDEENKQLKSEIIAYKKELENQNKQIEELKQLFYELSKTKFTWWNQAYVMFCFLSKTAWKN